jgi:hypothetical protein
MMLVFYYQYLSFVFLFILKEDLVMVTVYRSGGLLSVDELSNDSAVWFDAQSSRWLAFGDVARSRTVFSSMFVEDAWFWAERRMHSGDDATIWAIDVPDEVVLKAYRFARYDDVMRARDAGENYSWELGAYWGSGTDVSHWIKMWSRLFEGYEFSGDWEVLVDVDVAAKATWSVVHSHDEVVRILDEFPASALDNSFVPYPDDWDDGMDSWDELASV